MIKLQDLHKYKITTDRDNSSGWHYGVCYLQVELATGSIRFWWCGCRHCGGVTCLSLAELRRGQDCPLCGYNLTSENFHGFDWSTDRSLRSWEMQQEEMSAAYRLGGADAVQALATELHTQNKEAEQRHEEQREAIRKVWNP